MNSFISRTRLLKHFIAAAILSMTSITSSYATGLEPPIDFWGDNVLNGTLILVVDPALVTDLDVQFRAHKTGEVLSEQKLDLNKLESGKGPSRNILQNPTLTNSQRTKIYGKTTRRTQRIEFSHNQKMTAELMRKLKMRDVKADLRVPEAKRRFAVSIPLSRVIDVKKMKPGYIATKFIATAQWRQGGKKPIYVEQWVYFNMSNGKIKPVSLDEYSRKVDPAVKDISIEGKPVLMNLGNDRAEDTPLSKTKMSKAIAIGRLDGEPLEVSERKTRSAKRYVDESNEK